MIKAEAWPRLPLAHRAKKLRIGSEMARFRPKVWRQSAARDLKRNHRPIEPENLA